MAPAPAEAKGHDAAALPSPQQRLLEDILHRHWTALPFVQFDCNVSHRRIGASVEQNGPQGETAWLAQKMLLLHPPSVNCLMHGHARRKVSSLALLEPALTVMLFD